MVIGNYLRSIKMPLGLHKQIIIKDNTRAIKNFELWFNLIHIFGIVGIPVWVMFNGGQYSSIETDQG